MRSQQKVLQVHLVILNHPLKVRKPQTYDLVRKPDLSVFKYKGKVAKQG